MSSDKILAGMFEREFEKYRHRIGILRLMLLLAAVVLIASGAIMHDMNQNEDTVAVIVTVGVFYLVCELPLVCFLAGKLVSRKKY